MYEKEKKMDEKFDFLNFGPKLSRWHEFNRKSVGSERRNEKSQKAAGHHEHRRIN